MSLSDSRRQFIKCILATLGSIAIPKVAFALPLSSNNKLFLDKKFNIEQGKSKAIVITAIDVGYFKTELKDRLSIKFDIVSGT